MIRLGVIGYGGRIQGILDIIYKFKSGATVTAITDIRPVEIKKGTQIKGQRPEKNRLLRGRRQDACKGEARWRAYRHSLLASREDGSQGAEEKPSALP